MSDTPSKKVLSLKDRTADAASRVEERLHKVLAQAGLGSRRALEERIAQGVIKVNGEVARTGQSVSSGDRIEIDGKTFVATALTEPSSVLIYNKPEGQVTTREDPEGRETIFESLPRLKGARWIAVGRLDINTTGLLLLTTDGELANALMHPSNAIEREYVCRIPGEVPQSVVDRLARGVALEDGPAKFDKIERINATGSHAWFQVVVTEGRNREVRRLWESQGHQVSRLKRIRYGDVTLPRLLKRGQCVEMEAEQVEALRKQFGLENNDPVLTLQPVIGQRKARTTEIRVGKEHAKNSFVNGHVNEEARELRRFDHVREDKLRGRGRPGGRPGGNPGYKGRKAGPGGPKTFHGPMGADRPAHARPGRGNKPFGGPPQGGHRDDNIGNRIERGPAHDRGPQQDRGPQAPRGPRGPGGGPRGPGGGQPNPYGQRGSAQGPRGPGGNGPGGNGPGRGGPGGKPQGRGQGPRQPQGPAGHGGLTTEFRSWYVPEGVETGSKVAPPRGPRGPKPQGGHRGAPGGPQARGPRPHGHHGQPGNQRSPDGRPAGPRGPKPPFRKRPEGLPSDD